MSETPMWVWMTGVLLTGPLSVLIAFVIVKIYRWWTSRR